MIKQSLKNCMICERTFHVLHIHHINGNHVDNQEENKISVCASCHAVIHKGLKKGRRISYRSYKYLGDTFWKLKQLRDSLLSNKYPNKKLNRSKDLTNRKEISF